MKKPSCITSLLFCLLFIMLVTPTVSVQASGFRDTNTHWAKDYINQLSDSGLIAGYPDGAFMPDYPMSRAEFTALLITAMGLSPLNTTTKTFSDVGSHWAKGHINEAVQRGILVPSEYPEGLKPDGSVKRSEVCAMLVRALYQPPAAGKTAFKDQSMINQSMYKGHIKAASDMGLVNGYPDGTFRPFGNMKRGEICAVIVGFLAQQSESSGGAQPEVVAFFDENTLQHIGNSSTVSIKAGSNWVSFDLISISNPTTFSFNGNTYNFIGTSTKINYLEYEITDTAWHGLSKQFDILMKRK